MGRSNRKTIRIQFILFGAIALCVLLGWLFNAS